MTLNGLSEYISGCNGCTEYASGDVLKMLLALLGSRECIFVDWVFDLKQLEVTVSA